MHLPTASLLIISLLFITTHSTTTQSGLLVLDLQSTNTADFANELADWTKTGSTSPYYSTCNSALIMGGSSIGGSFSKTYTYLSVHNVIYFSMIIYPIDDWVMEDYLTITIGSLSFQLSGVGRSGSTSPYPSNLCGSASYNDMPPIYVRGKVVHSGTQIDLSFQAALTYASNRESFGVREISLRLATENSPDGSYGCFVPTGAYTTDNMCTCTSSITQFFSGSCQTCSPQCQTCINSPSFCTTCIANYYFNGQNCVACQSPCLKCNSATQCTQCIPGYYLLSDGTCSATCASPMTQVTSPIYKCVPPCADGQYTYWDGSCESFCPYPYIVDYVGKDPICTNGCSVLLFLYPDATCQATCVGTVNTVKGFSLCNYPCVSPNFIYGNGTCSTSCNAPFTSVTYANIKFCAPPPSTPYLLPNATVTASCSSGSVGSFASGASVCINPNAGSYILQNGSAVTTYGAAFTKVTVGLIDYCNLKCPYGQYYFSVNDTCSATCRAPFVPKTVGIETYCLSPCSGNQYIATNGICSTRCPPPLIIDNSTGYNFCFTTSTSPDLFVLQNLTLVSECYTPWFYDTTLAYKVCDIPCTNKTDYLTPLMKCIPTCNGPLIPILDDYYKFCTTPCPFPDLPYYKSDTGNCVASCVLPYIVDTNAVILQCSLPSLTINAEGVFTQINKYISSSFPLFGTAISAISNGGAGIMAFGIMALSRQLYYVRFLKINFNQDFHNFLVTTNYTISPSFGFSLPTSWLNLPPYQQIPDRIEGWGLSSYFIYNYWENLTTILVSLGLLILISGGHIYAKKENLNKEWTFLLKKLSSMFRWNFFLTIFCSSYDSLIIYIVLEFRHYNFATVTGIVSFILALLAFILMFCFLFLSYILILECNQRVLKTQFTSKEEVAEDGRRFHLNWQGFLVLFQGYDNENASLFAQAYIFCFLSRSIIWGLIIILLNEYPLVQVILLLLINLVFFLALVFKKPFTSQVSEIVIPLLELLVVFVDILLLVSAIADINPGVNVSKFKIGIILRYSFDAFTIACFLIVLLYTGLGIKNTRKFYNLTIKERKATFPTVLASPFVGYIINSSQLEGPDNMEVSNKRYQMEESKVVKLINGNNDNNVTLSNIPEHNNRNDDTGLISDMPETHRTKEKKRTFASTERLKIEGMRNILLNETASPTKTRKTSEDTSPSTNSRLISMHEDRRDERREERRDDRDRRTRYEQRPPINSMPNNPTVYPQETKEVEKEKPKFNVNLSDKASMNNTQSSVASRFHNMLNNVNPQNNPNLANPFTSNPNTSNSGNNQIKNNPNAADNVMGNTQGSYRSLARINTKTEPKAPAGNIWERSLGMPSTVIEEKAESEITNSNLNVLNKKPETIPRSSSPIREEDDSPKTEFYSPNKKATNIWNAPLQNSEERPIKEEYSPSKARTSKNDFNDPRKGESLQKRGGPFGGDSFEQGSVYSKTEHQENNASPIKNPRSRLTYTQNDDGSPRKGGYN